MAFVDGQSVFHSSCFPSITQQWSFVLIRLNAILTPASPLFDARFSRCTVESILDRDRIEQ